MWWWILACSKQFSEQKDQDITEHLSDTASNDSGVQDVDDTDVTDVSVQECAAQNLRVVGLDVWGQDLDVSVSGLGGLSALSTTLLDDAIYPMEVDRSLNLQISAEGHYPTQVQVKYNHNASNEDAFTSTLQSEDGVMLYSWDVLEIDGMRCPTFTVFVGLEHVFFASTGDAPTRNDVDFLINGEELWSAVADDLPLAQDDILYSTWWWESDFELIREHNPYLSSFERYNHRLMTMVNESSAHKRILINQFWGDNTDYSAYINTDTELRDAAESRFDDIEVMLQPNMTPVDITSEFPTPDLSVNFVPRVLANPKYANSHLIDRNPQAFTLDVASWHQKLIVLDQDIAYVMGMNSKQSDWDSNEHLLFDDRRMEYDASTSDRVDVAQMEEMAELEPRRDYGVRIEGPIVTQIQEVFAQRWEVARENAIYADKTTEYAPEIVENKEEQGVLAQLQLTQPSPLQSASLLDGHLQAIRQAKEYILIEDQYFRAPILNEAILEQMRLEPDLLVIVITMDVANYDPGLKYSYLSEQAFVSEFPNRFLLLTMLSTEVLWDIGIFFDTAEIYQEAIFIHSKLRIIDDEYLSVGSGNMNNRGYKYEGEMNVSVWDPDWVKTQRREIFRQYVGAYANYLSDDAQNNFEVLKMVAEENQIQSDWWQSNGFWMDSEVEMLNNWAIHPITGFVHPLSFSDMYIDIASPDVF